MMPGTHYMGVEGKGTHSDRNLSSGPTEEMEAPARILDDL